MVLSPGAMKFLSSLPLHFLLAAFVLASCGSDSASSANRAPELPEPSEPIELSATAAPFELGPIDAGFYEAISYGPFDENLFDIYIPAADAPTPLFIWIHGGGFTGGSRDTEGREDLVLPLLAEGVAFASIDYRLLQSPDPDGVIKPLTDSARAVQFMRYHAAQLNIDRDNVIVAGGSAGAGTALWIAFADDLADPDSEDPVLQFSTRVTAAIAIETQGTYDIGKWSTVVFEEYDLDLLMLADALGLSQALLDFYGITEVEDFDSEEILEYRARVDMLDLMDIDDPPFYAANRFEDDVPPLSVGVAFHHANHALVLHERAEEIGLENVSYMPVLGIEDPSGEDQVDFALRQFGL